MEESAHVESVIIPSIVEALPRFPNKIDCDFTMFDNVEKAITSAISDYQGKDFDNIMTLRHVPMPVITTLTDILYGEPIKVTSTSSYSMSFAFTVYINYVIDKWVKKFSKKKITVVDFSSDSGSVLKRLENYNKGNNPVDMIYYSYGTNTYKCEDRSIKVIAKLPKHASIVVCYHNVHSLIKNEQRLDQYFKYISEGAWSMMVLFDAFKASRIDMERKNDMRRSAYDFRVMWVDKNVIRYSLCGTSYQEEKITDKKVYAIYRKYGLVPRFMPYSNVKKRCKVTGSAGDKLTTILRRSKVLSKYTRIIISEKDPSESISYDVNEKAIRFDKTSSNNHLFVESIQPVAMTSKSFKILREFPIVYADKIDGVQAVVYLYKNRNNGKNLYLRMRNGQCYETCVDYTGSPVILQVTCLIGPEALGDHFFCSAFVIEDVIKLGRYINARMDFSYRQLLYSAWQQQYDALNIFTLKKWKVYEEEKVDYIKSVSVEGLIFQSVECYRYNKGNSVVYYGAKVAAVYLKNDYTVDLSVWDGKVNYCGKEYIYKVDDAIYEFALSKQVLLNIVRRRSDKMHPNSVEAQYALSSAMDVMAFNSMSILGELEKFSVKKIPTIYSKFMKGDIMTDLPVEEVALLISSGCSQFIDYTCTEEQIESFYEWRYEYVTYSICKQIGATVENLSNDDFEAVDLSIETYNSGY